MLMENALVEAGNVDSGLLLRPLLTSSDGECHLSSTSSNACVAHCFEACDKAALHPPGNHVCNH